MKIATWNVNSIRARIDPVTAWLRENQPDVLCLQETKVLDEMFPHAVTDDVGRAVYRIDVWFVRVNDLNLAIGQRNERFEAQSVVW